ncbi:hypothetical protein ElyMa_005348300 [Elysia marginata]|uniref:Reverse transcriptase Ty1/copia-type domain-containing protein n=1 Tax=Elysia marginata TaxID=1093978 RepID=A0AAV4EAV6_9GAST|nr:hypothetical protein ElyMa_005348300 [Elysia marginata]
MFAGSKLLAQCDAHIGYGGTMVLLMYINDTLIRHSDEELGIQITSAGAPHGGYQTMLLTAERMSPTLNRMIIGCFSYDIAAFPNKHFQCHNLDELCHVTEPIRVICKAMVDWSIDLHIYTLTKYLKGFQLLTLFTKKVTMA